MTEPVPVSGEDQPDPRFKAIQHLWASGEQCVEHGWTEPIRDYECPGCIIAAIDAADRAAGIRRVTEQFARHQMWGAWDDGYEAARNGQQKRNPHRAPVAAAVPVPVQEDQQ